MYVRGCVLSFHNAEMHYSFFLFSFCSHLVNFYQTGFNFTDSCLSFVESADEFVKGFLHFCFRIFISSISILRLLMKFYI